MDHKEGWEPKNWCFWTVVLEKTLESPLDCKIKPINPKGNQPWIFFGRTDAEAEALILWPLDVNSRPVRKDPDAGKDWGQEVKGVTEDKIDGITNSTDMSWASFGRWWRTGKPGVLQSVGSQRGRHDWVIEQQKVWWCLLSMRLLHFKILVYFCYCKKLS